MDGMRHLLDETIASVRRISSDLRPLILDDLGFGEAVTWQAQEIAKRANLEIHLELHNADLVTDPHVSTSLFRIVQESLTNVLRHSEATRVEIDLSSDDKNLTLSIRDNGKGFRDTGRQSGIGLLNMRERSLSMGGQFQIISAPGDGSTILVTTPLPNPLPQPTHLAAKPGETT
jgi:signal transduction histidine kinase